jgi:hypothetical protein
LRKHIAALSCATLVSFLSISMAGAQGDTAPAATLLSAFYGLDNALPLGANGLCLGARNQDGMPVILSQVIDPDTLDAADFAVTTASGNISTPFCVTLSPAVDAGELRTVLLIGEFGSAENDPPVRVDVVDDLLASSDGANFMGAGVEVTPLSSGPTLIVAESVPASQWMLDRGSGRQQGTGCPSAGTMQIVRATWAGGVSNADGEEAGEPERLLYRVALRQHDGSVVEATPFALADLGDGDNNHLLCLNVGGQPETVYFPAGHLYDPNQDTLNPETIVSVQPDSTLMSQQVRNVRYCEVVPTYRSGITLRTEIWNTLGLNDCPQDAWDALDAPELETQLGAVNVRLNGPRYWVIDEIAALGGVTATGEQATFGSIDMTLRAILETRLRGDLVGDQLYSPNTVQRDTRYVFYAGELMFTLTSPEGDVYAMQSFAQIIDPTLTIDALESLGERLSLPEGWTYQAVRLAQDYFLLSGGETTIVQDDFLNTYQRIRIPLPNVAL